MQSLSKFKAVELIRATNGHLFGCTFRKKDNTLRSMLCLIPRKKAQPKRASPAKENNSYVLVRDMVKYKSVFASTGDKIVALDASYRLVNLATLERLTISGVTYNVD